MLPQSLPRHIIGSIRRALAQKLVRAAHKNGYSLGIFLEAGLFRRLRLFHISTPIKIIKFIDVLTQ